MASRARAVAGSDASAAPAVKPLRSSGASQPAPFPWHRVPLLALALVSLLAGLDAATQLLGLPAPVTAARLGEVHGPLMVIGFVGTLIALERAVALRHPAGFAAPALLGIGSVLLVTTLPLRVGQSLLVAGALAMLAVYVPLWRRRPDDAVTVQVLGAVLMLGATLLWWGGTDVAALLPWLVGFVVLTIAGERLELARLHIGPDQGVRLVQLALLLGSAAVATALWPAAYPVFGISLLALAAWLARRDVARRTIRSSGLPQFSAACLLAGYAWLVVAGTVWAVTGAAADTPAYDVVVHATFLGFTVSMILAHAPVILPAILRRPLPYHRAMLVPAGLLQASLAVRLWLGDGLGWHAGWQLGGVLNEVALLGFIGVAAWSARTSRRSRA